MNLASAMASILQAEGIDTLFCYPTTKIIDAAALVGIRPVVVRQERSGLHMADACSRLGGGRRIGAFVRSDPARLADSVSINAAIDAMSPLVQSAAGADAAREIEALVNALAAPIASIAAESMANSVHRSALDIHELRRQQFDELILTCGLLLSAMGLIALLWRQNRVVERMHQRLGHEAPAIGTEVARGIWLLIVNHDGGRLSGSCESRAARTGSRPACPANGAPGARPRRSRRPCGHLPLARLRRTGASARHP